MCVGIRIFTAALLALLLASFLFGAVAEKQAGAADAKTSISGVVTDRTGNVLAGAKVALDGPDKREAQSADNGGYSFTGLKPGVYKLTVTFPSFPPQVYSDIYLKPGMELPIDVALEGTAPSAAASEQPAQSQQEQSPQPPQSTIPLMPPPTVMPVLAGRAQAERPARATGRSAESSPIRKARL